MQKIILDDRVIYRAEDGKKLKIVNSERLYREIVLSLNDSRQVEEVDA